MAHRSGLGGAFEKLKLEMFSVAGQKLSFSATGRLPW